MKNLDHELEAGRSIRSKSDTDGLEQLEEHFVAKVGTDEEETQKIGNVYLKDIAQVLSSHFRRMTNDELGVTLLQVSFQIESLSIKFATKPWDATMLLLS